MLEIKKWVRWITVAGLLLLHTTNPAATATTATTTFIPAGAVWKYLDDGSNQATVWREIGFDDSGWPSGQAELGYGDGDEATVVSYGSNPDVKYATTYFRHTFSVTNPGDYNYLKLNIVKDDGAVVYLNGTEVYRYNMPPGDATYATWAAATIPTAAENVFSNATIAASLLVTGSNVLAVEIHQVAPTSSDISFDASLTSAVAAATAPKNVILFIGDGMGPEQIRAAGMYQNGSSGTLFMESFPYSSTMTTYSAEAAVTDSAASATAMATGIKVTNGVLSQASPGNGADLETLAELFHRACKRVGLVTTAYVTHATPAGFGAHEPSRNNLTQIAGDYLTQSKPDVLMGGGANGMSTTTAALAGYTVVTGRVDMQALDPANITRVSGQFGNTHLPYEYSGSGYDTLPHLSEMVSTTLALLNNDPDGFFLMVEGGRIDHAGHSNLLAENIFETLEFDHAINVAYTWAMSRSDTLIIVTADHETGGLEILANNGAGNFPTVNWITTTHTATPVPVYAWGMHAELATEVHDNTDIYWLARVGLGEVTSCTITATRGLDVQSNARPDWVAWAGISLAGLVWLRTHQKRTSSRKSA